MVTTLYNVTMSQAVYDSLDDHRPIPCKEDNKYVYLFKDEGREIIIQPLTLDDIQSGSDNFTLFLSAGGRHLLGLPPQVRDRRHVILTATYV